MLRIVAHRDEYIHLMKEGQRNNFQILKDLPLNLKIHVHDKNQPLNLRFNYDNASIARSVKLFCSFSCREPDEDNFDLTRVITERNQVVQVFD